MGKVREHLEDFRTKNQYVKDKLETLDRYLGLLVDLINVTKNEGIDVSKLKLRILGLEVLPLDADTLNKAIDIIKEDLKEVILELLESLIPGSNLSNDLIECINNLLDYTNDFKEYKAFRGNIHGLSQYKHVAKYVSLCIKSYCNMVDLVMSGELHEVLETLNKIMRELSEVSKELDILININECVNIIVQNSCLDNGQYLNIANGLRDVANTVKAIKTVM